MNGRKACAATAALALAAIASPRAEAMNIQLQSGLICDTAAQAARVSELAGAGDVRLAILKVNLEAAKPTACGYAQVAFTNPEEIETVRAPNGVRLFRIVRITVIGVNQGAGLKPVAPMTQFALAEPESEEA
mgnify:CR=1 FL=1